MTWQLTEWVCRNSSSTRADKAVLLVLAHRTSRDGLCNPGIDRIASDAGVSSRTVKRCIQKLVNTGELEIIRKGGKEQYDETRKRTSLYRIITPEAYRDEVTSATTEGDRPASNVVTFPRGKGDTVSPKRNVNEVRNVNRNVGSITINDYGDIYNRQNSPIDLAVALTNDRKPISINCWKKMLRCLGDDLFRKALAEAFGKLKEFEYDRPGSVLTTILKEFEEQAIRSKTHVL